jgi:REP element-mobilizing transposase RayT
LRFVKLALFKNRAKMGGTQLELSFARGRGGARLGAGRKRLPAHQRRTPHRARAEHRAAQPVHVTLRAASRSLRSRFVSKTVLRALRDSNTAHFGVVHYSVQDSHLHLIVEAASTAALLSGMRGLMVRVARRVNRMLFRLGRFWADRWPGRALIGPRQVRNALVYVLQNRLKHCVLRHSDARAAAPDHAELDPLSSAQWFHGFARSLPRGFRSVGPPCVVAPKTWLLVVGWLRHGRIRFDEAPKS